MKISWGMKITVTYVLFIIGVLIMVLVFMNQDVHLVTDNYYMKELEYQNQIDKINRTNELPKQLEIIKEEQSLKLVFPLQFKSEKIEGSIQLYRPSDPSKDFSISINTDSSGSQTISTEKFSKGIWKLKVDWAVMGIGYYNEKILMVN
jgi:hypothetical protein